MSESLQAGLQPHCSKSSIITNSDESITIIRSFFPALEGELQQSTFLKIGLCMSKGGRVRFENEGKPQIKSWNHNDLYITGPNANGYFSSPDVDMIGIAIDVERYELPKSEAMERLLFSNQIMSDSLISSIILALWNTIDFYGNGDRKRSGDRSAFVDQAIDIIIQRLDEACQPLKPIHDSSHGLSPRQLKLVEKYIDEHISNGILVEQLSSLLDMESKSFSASLLAATGFRPLQFITSRRLEFAKQLLKEGKNITETALMVGYSNPSKFSSAFSRMVGCSPTKWRRL